MSQPPNVKQLTDRDMSVLEWVGRAGIAAVDQVADRFWPRRSLRTAEERVRRLARAGYLEVHTCDLRRPGEMVVCLTEAGWNLFNSALRERLQVGLPSPAEVRQQLVAQEARALIEREIHESGGHLVEWLYERELRAELRRKSGRGHGRVREQLPADIPDARATVRTPKGSVEILDVEVDGAYYGKMLYQKAKCLSKSGSQVVWVCTAERAAYLQEALAGYPNIRVFTLHPP